MTHKLRRRDVSSAIEKRILTSLIVSTQFNHEIAHLLDLDYFTNTFIKTVARWCIDFFDTYEKAPFDHIEDIFNQRKLELNDEDIELIETLLKDISKKYELDSGLNVDYSVQQALDYFRMRQVYITHSNIEYLLNKNDIDGAEQQISNHIKVTRLTSGWVDPFDEDMVDDIFKEEGVMFKFPGELGNFLGGFDRGWLVAIAAAFKRGKTFQMQELAVAAIQQNLKVAFFSLEMYKTESNKRLYQRLLGAGLEERGDALYPCFDCASNQDGSCKKEQRTNRIKLLSDNKKPKFSPASKYNVCTYCRTSDNKKDKKDYKIAWWKELIERPAFNKTNVKKHVEAMSKLHKNHYRFKQYPRFSANTSDITRELDLLERSEGFIPDVIVIDYADILKPEGSGASTETSSLDDTWKSLARLAGERQALVVTASQITRAGTDKKQVRLIDMALWVGKTAHVDVFYALNQTPEEKAEGVMRVSLLAHRYADFNENANCAILQNLTHGQVCLDSEIIYQ